MTPNAKTKAQANNGRSSPIESPVPRSPSMRSVRFDDDEKDAVTPVMSSSPPSVGTAITAAAGTAAAAAATPLPPAGGSGASRRASSSTASSSSALPPHHDYNQRFHGQTNHRRHDTTLRRKLYGNVTKRLRRAAEATSRGPDQREAALSYLFADLCRHVLPQARDVLESEGENAHSISAHPIANNKVAAAARSRETAYRRYRRHERLDGVDGISVGRPRYYEVLSDFVAASSFAHANDSPARELLVLLNTLRSFPYQPPLYALLLAPWSLFGGDGFARASSKKQSAAASAATPSATAQDTFSWERSLDLICDGLSMLFQADVEAGAGRYRRCFHLAVYALQLRRAPAATPFDDIPASNDIGRPCFLHSDIQRRLLALVARYSLFYEPPTVVLANGESVLRLAPLLASLPDPPAASSTEGESDAAPEYLAFKSVARGFLSLIHGGSTTNDEQQRQHQHQHQHQQQLTFFALFADEVASFLPSLAGDESALLRCLDGVHALEHVRDFETLVPAAHQLRLEGALYRYMQPGGPFYPSKDVRRHARRALDALRPSGSRVRRGVNLLVHVLFYPSYWIPTLLLDPWHDARKLVRRSARTVRRKILRLHESVFGGWLVRG